MNNGDVFKIDIEDFEEFVGSVNRERIEQAHQLGMADEDVPLIKYEWFMDNYWYYYSSLLLEISLMRVRPPTNIRAIPMSLRHTHLLMERYTRLLVM